ncbi:MAG TPA: BTAD domain-containing putative transcriptional regulator [Candidatus Baltobacteraceae bacterium]
MGLSYPRSGAAAFLAILVALALVSFVLWWYRARKVRRERDRAGAHLARIASALASAQSMQALETLVTVEPALAMKLTFAVLYRSTAGGAFECVATAGPSPPAARRLLPEDPLLVRLRATRREVAESASVAWPIVLRDELYAIVCYGPHRTGADLDLDERAALRGLVAPAERAYAAHAARLESVRKLSEFLQHADAAENRDRLQGYLVDQILESVPEQTRTAIVACALVPDAGAAEIVAVTGDESCAARLDEFGLVSPLIRMESSETYFVHPSLAHVVARRFPDLRHSTILRCASLAGESGRYHRAAELYMLADMREAAMDQLEAALADQSSATVGMGESNSGLVTRLTFEELVHRPHLWIRSCVQRLFRDDVRALLDEANLLAQSADGAALPAFLTQWFAFLHSEAGDWETSRTLLQSLPGCSDLTAFTLARAQTLECAIAGRLGRVGECERMLQSVDRGEFPTPAANVALRALVRAFGVERMRGRWDEERAQLDLAIDSLEMQGSRFVLTALSEAVAGAWLSGNAGDRQRYLASLKRAVERYDAKTLEHFSAAFDGRSYPASGTESPRCLAWAHLAECCDAYDWDTASAFAKKTLGQAVRSHEPFLQMLACLACHAFATGGEGDENLRRAFELADAVDSPELYEAMRAAIAGSEECGMLTAFVSRLRRPREGTGAPLTVEIAAGRVRRGRVPVALSERELAIAVALARSEQPTPAAELAELIWPELDESAALRAVQTTVHRLRQRLQDSKAIRSTARGYSLRADVETDLGEIERFVRATRGDRPLDAFDALRLAAIAARLDASRPAFMANWEWFGPIERRIEEWSRAAKQRLAEDALAGGRADRALFLAHSIIDRDELDEPAREIAIRAYAAAGDLAGARREFRRYRELTLRELRAEPSPELFELLEGGPPE